MIEFLGCQINTDIPQEQIAAIVRTESSVRQYAIGVVGGFLNRQPENEQQAIETVQMLENTGKNYSVGVAQVNRVNFKKYGLSEKNMFDTCDNLNAGAKILAACFKQHQDWQKAYSCYYSGNPTTGFAHGYVKKVSGNLNKPIPVALTPQKISLAKQPIVFVPYKKHTTQSKKRNADSVPMSLTQRRLSSSFF